MRNLGIHEGSVGLWAVTCKGELMIPWLHRDKQNQAVEGKSRQMSTELEKEVAVDQIVSPSSSYIEALPSV